MLTDTVPFQSAFVLHLKHTQNNGPKELKALGNSISEASATICITHVMNRKCWPRVMFHIESMHVHNVAMTVHVYRKFQSSPTLQVRDNGALDNQREY